MTIIPLSKRTKIITTRTISPTVVRLILFRIYG